MHLSDTRSIAQHLKNPSCQKTEFRVILTENTILEKQNRKQKFQILEALPIGKKLLKLNRNHLNSIK